MTGGKLDVYEGLTDDQAVRYIRESMPLDTGVMSMPETVVDGDARFNVMVLRARGPTIVSQVNIWMQRSSGPMTRARCSLLVERYLDLHRK